MALLQGFASVNTDEPGAGQVEQTLEAQEARVIGSYEHALVLLQAPRHDEAEGALRQLLAEPVVADCASDQLHRVKFLALRNLGDLLARRGPGGSGAPDALAAYCQATEVVGDDAGLWNRLGTLASEVGYWAAARNAFERGLELDPQHPTMPDKLLQLLLHVGDGGAAAALAAALLRANPRHAGAAAVVAAQRSGRPLPVPCAGLLQLAPVADVAAARGSPACQQQHHHHLERPRTLEQPSWQQLLHHSLLFLASNKLVEGRVGPATPSAAATAAAGAAERAHNRHVASVVRFTYKRPHPPPSQQQAAAAATTTAAAGLNATAAPMQAAAGRSPAPGAAAGEPAAAAAACSDGQQQQQQGASLAAVEQSPGPSAMDSSPGASVPAAPMAAAPVPAAGTAATSTPQPLPSGATFGGTFSGTSPAPSEPANSPAASLSLGGQQAQEAAADEEHEQQHPNKRASGGVKKAVTRATRSRAATGEVAALPLTGVAGRRQASPQQEASELLVTLGFFLSVPQQAALGAAAPPPLLSSPRKHVCLETAGEPLPQQQGGASEAAVGVAQPLPLPAQQEQHEAGGEADAVKAFLKRLPPQGIRRHELALLLLNTLGVDSAATELAVAARQQLLEVAHAVQHSVPELPPAHCLVLGELFADAVAVAACTRVNRGGGTVPGLQQQAAGMAPRQLQGIRARRGELTSAQLEQSARLWLMRYRLAAAEVPPAAAVPAATAAQAGAVTGENGKQAEQPPQLNQVAGMVRYLWATGRLLESGRDVRAAAAAYASCQGGLGLLGGGRVSIALPHCTTDAAISCAAVRRKQEGLQLHGILEGAEVAAAAGDHAAVAVALAPVLLCCSDKEQDMLQLHHEQWLQGMQLLLAAATGAQSWALALRCHLRLLNALLPHVPPQLAVAMQSGIDPRKDEAKVASLPPALLLSTAEQLAAQPMAAAALDAAAAFLQQHATGLSLADAQPTCSTKAGLGGSGGGGSDAICRDEGHSQQQQQQQQVALHPLEQAMYKAVQQQLLVAVAGCAAALPAVGLAAAESRLNLKVNTQRAAMCNAATALLCLSSLASGSGGNISGARPGGALVPAAGATVAAGSAAQPGLPPLSVADRGHELAWHLCDALGSAQALMERHGCFVKACLSELLSLQRQLEASVAAPAPAPAPPAGAGAVDGQELAESLAAGVQHCLFWLYGLELPGLDDAKEWGGDFQLKGTAAEVSARQLTSKQAVAEVWWLMEPLLLQDIEHVAKHKGFLQAAAAQFSVPPAALAERSSAAWRQLLAATPPLLPCEQLDTMTAPDPMQQLLQMAAAPAAGPAQQAQQGVEAMVVDGVMEASEAAGGAVEGVAVARGAAGEEVQYEHVYRSLYHLLAALQDEEPAAHGSSLLDSRAEEELEAALQTAKLDLCFNPARSSSWERLAVDYHAAADDLLNEASETMSHREWKHNSEVPGRVRRWRRLAYWASAGAWLSSNSENDQVRLLMATGSRLLEDVLRTLPWQEPLASPGSWQATKRDASGSYRRACELAHAAFEMAETAQELVHDAPDWEVLLCRARCLRKLEQPPENWLQRMARACHVAAKDAGGALLPLYALHAARMRLLLGMPSAKRWAAATSDVGRPFTAWRQQQRGVGGDAAAEGQPRKERDWERAVLQLAGYYCFLPATNTSLHSPSQPARHPPVVAADAEMAADWRGMVQDCCAAMHWCLDRDRGFHPAAYRLAAALQQLGEPHKAVATLAPLFSRARLAFLPVMQPIRESKVAGAGRSRPSKHCRRSGSRGPDGCGGKEAGGQSTGVGRAMVPDCRWGEPPDRLSSVGMEEDAATFNSRLRKTVGLYLSCLTDAAVMGATGSGASAGGGQEPGRQPLEVLHAAATFFAGQQGASKVYAGFDKLARGHLLLALVAGLHACCPMDQLEARPAGPSLAPLPSATAATMPGFEGGEPQFWLVQEQAPPPAAAGAPAAPQQTPGAAALAAHHAVPPSGAAVQTGRSSLGQAAVTPYDAGAAAEPSWHALPTPATTRRQQLAAHMLQLAARLDGAAVGPWLAKAHQVFSELLLHTKADDRWRSVALPSMQEALRSRSSELAAGMQMHQLADDKPDSGGAEVLRKLFSLYAALYVHLLQWQDDPDRLLQLLLAMKKKVKSFAAAESRQARFLRRQALLLSDALLGTLSASLASAELQAASMAAAAEAMEIEGPAVACEAELAEGCSPAAAGAQQAQQRHQEVGSDATASSPVPGSAACGQRQAVAETPAVAGPLHHSITPGTDLRAALGTPRALPSVEQQQLAERGTVLLQLAHSFHRDIARWLQIVGAVVAAGSSNSAREELRALGSSGEEVLLRAYRLHVSLTQPVGAASPGTTSRAEWLKAADEAVKQLRRQSKQAGAAARQQAQAAGSGVSVLPAIAEGMEAAAVGGRKRCTTTAPEDAPLRSTRKRGHSSTADPDDRSASREQEEDGQEEEGKAAAGSEDGR